MRNRCINILLMGPTNEGHAVYEPVQQLFSTNKSISGHYFCTGCFNEARFSLGELLNI